MIDISTEIFFKYSIGKNMEEIWGVLLVLQMQVVRPEKRLSFSPLIAGKVPKLRETCGTSIVDSFGGERKWCS